MPSTPNDGFWWLKLHTENFFTTILVHFSEKAYLCNLIIISYDSSQSYLRYRVQVPHGGRAYSPHHSLCPTEAGGGGGTHAPQRVFRQKSQEPFYLPYRLRRNHPQGRRQSADHPHRNPEDMGRLGAATLPPVPRRTVWQQGEHGARHGIGDCKSPQTGPQVPCPAHGGCLPAWPHREEHRRTRGLCEPPGVRL